MTMTCPFDHPEFAALVAGLGETRAVPVCWDWLEEHGHDDLARLASGRWQLNRRLFYQGEIPLRFEFDLTSDEGTRLPPGTVFGPVFAVERGTLGRNSYIVPRAFLKQCVFHIGGADDRFETEAVVTGEPIPLPRFNSPRT